MIVNSFIVRLRLLFIPLPVPQHCHLAQLLPEDGRVLVLDVREALQDVVGVHPAPAARGAEESAQAAGDLVLEGLGPHRRRGCRRNGPEGCSETPSWG